MGGDQLAGQQQAPGGGVDEQRRAVAQVRLPVAVADLVADQGVTGAFVRDAQQRFGQAHQRHAFLGAEGEFLQQALYDAGTAAGALLVAQLFGDACGKLVGGLSHVGRQARLLQQHRHHFRLGSAIGPGDGRAQHRLRQNALGKLQEALMSVVGLYVTHIVAAVGARGTELGQGCTTLQLLQVIEDGLLDQPVRRPVDGLRGGLEAFAGRVVELDAQGGGSHVLSSSGPRKRGNKAGGKSSRALSWVQPGATRLFHK